MKTCSTCRWVGMRCDERPTLYLCTNGVSPFYGVIEHPRDTVCTGWKPINRKLPEEK